MKKVLFVLMLWAAVFALAMAFPRRKTGHSAPLIESGGGSCSQFGKNRIGCAAKRQGHTEQKADPDGSRRNVQVLREAATHHMCEKISKKFLTSSGSCA